MINPKYKIVIADFDFNRSDIIDGKSSMDILEKLRVLLEYIPQATSAKMIFTPQLEAKDASRVRIDINLK